MPKNKQGGKKHKKYARHSDAFTRELIIAEDGQYYALVNKHLGNGRVNVLYIDPDRGGIEILATIRGSFRRRRGANFVSINNIVLISLRDFQSDKCDIIHVYKQEEINQLKKIGEISDNLSPKDNKQFQDDMEFNDFEEEKEPTKKNKVAGLGRNNVVKDNYGILSDEESE